MSTTAAPPRRSPFISPARGPSPRRAPAPPVVAAGLLAAAASIVAWLIADPHTPDLAAAVYRADLYRAAGFVVFDNNWYAGHDVPGYSLLFPPFAALVGLRAAGALAVLASTALFAAIVARRYAPGPALVACVAFGLAASADLWIGRLTFALGVTLGLAAVLAATRGRWWLAAPLSGLCAAASPVAGAFLVLAALAYALAERAPGRGAALGAPALVVVGGMAVLFPEGGHEPFPATSFAAALAAALVFLALVPSSERALRIGGVLYLLAVVAALLVPSPMGSNVDRLGVLFALPLLIAAAASQPRRRRHAPLGVLALAAAGLAVWIAWGPVREVAKVSGDPSTTVAYYAPLERFLEAHLRLPARIEVPLTRSHWEVALLGARYALARGWERQLDTRYDALFFGKGLLPPSAYHAWLLAEAVRYVALPDVALDGSSIAEARLLRAGTPFLRPVFASAHWRVWEVVDARPLASGPGALVALGHDRFTLRAVHAGRFVVRIHYTRYWALPRGAGCVGRAAGGWTEVVAQRAGLVTVRARFSLGRALGGATVCRGGPGASARLRSSRSL